MGLLKSLFGLFDDSENLANLARESCPAPNSNEAQYQKEALEELQSGIVPTGYSLKGYLSKKGEKLIYSVNGVTHYCSAVHSQWAGRSAGTSVRIAKGFWIRTGANRGHSVQHTSMERQGGGCLVLTNQALSFISSEKSARILLSHVLSFQAGSGGGASDYEFSVETDHARNNSHRFAGINPVTVDFFRSVLELLANGPSSVPTPPKRSPAAPIVPPALPAALEDIPEDAPHLKFTYTRGPKK
jgi:hypothetical protein